MAKYPQLMKQLWITKGFWTGVVFCSSGAQSLFFPPHPLSFPIVFLPLCIKTLCPMLKKSYIIGFVFANHKIIIEFMTLLKLLMHERITFILHNA